MAVERARPRRLGRAHPPQETTFATEGTEDTEKDGSEEGRRREGTDDRATAVGWARPTVFLMRATSDERRATIPSADSERAAGQGIGRLKYAGRANPENVEG